MRIPNRQMIKGLAVGALVSILGSSTTWATLEIKVGLAGNGFIGLTSTASQGGVAVASSTWSGAWNAEIVGGTLDGAGLGPPDTVYDIGDKWVAFCTDIGNTMSAGTWTYQWDTFSAGTDVGNSNGTPPDPSWAAGGTSGRRAAYIYNLNIGSVVDDTSRAAMAIAIWEALYDDGSLGYWKVDDAPSGTGSFGFMVTHAAGDLDAAAAVTTANGWLASLTEGNNLTWFAEMEPGLPAPVASGDVQSIIGPPNPVPEPSTYVAAALLALPFLASTVRVWRRKRS